MFSMARGVTRRWTVGRIIKRGTKARPRFYLKYVDTDSVDRTKAAKGAYTIAQARVMLAEIERRIMNGKVGIIEPRITERQRVVGRPLRGRIAQEVQASPACLSNE
jgi:hypothetical protein